MATSNSAVAMVQTANEKERNAKAKEGTVSAKEKDGATKAKEQTFVWTNNKVELLLKITHEYKVKKAGENVDWESVRSKYSDIWEQLKRQLPPDSEEAREIGKDLPRKKRGNHEASSDHQIEGSSTKVQAGCGFTTKEWSWQSCAAVL